MALIGMGLKANQSVGLFSINREEWCITEQACFASGLVTVPLYDTLGVESIAYICDQTEMEIIFTSSDKLKLLTSMIKEIKNVKKIVCYDFLSAEDSAKYTEATKESGLEILKRLLNLDHLVPKICAQFVTLREQLECPKVSCYLTLPF